MISKKYINWIYPVLSGIILSSGWQDGFIQVAVLSGFIPLLFVEEYYFLNPSKFSGWKIFLKSYLAFFIWNAVSTYWIWNASEAGAIMAIVLNSLFMSIVFMIFHTTKKTAGRRIGNIAFVTYWLGFEYLHLNWELSWTWLTLGNGLSHNVMLIQWYEFTGTLGGSLWILLCNLAIFEFMRCFPFTVIRKRNIKLIVISCVVLLPVLISLLIYSGYEEKGDEVEVVVVQPNIDPYNDKFSGMPVEKQLDRVINLALQKTTDTTDYVIAPETAIPQGIWEEDIESHPDIIMLKSIINRFPGVKLIIGASTYRMYDVGETLSPTSRKFDGEETYYDSYNTALQLDSTENVQVYHKSKLVLGVEKMPFLNTFTFLKDISFELGGTSGSLGTQPEAEVFMSQNPALKIAPAICYESIYGEYINDYVKKGAGLIFVITNDGWWGNTSGYRQHLSYSSLRAIETRRSIARSANTGISCFINQLGQIQQATPWWEEAVIRQKIRNNNGTTFYVKMGDYPGRMSALVACLIFIFSSWMKIYKRKKPVSNE